jgi:hypothetical protein
VLNILLHTSTTVLLLYERLKVFSNCPCPLKARDFKELLHALCIIHVVSVTYVGYNLATIC